MKLNTAAIFAVLGFFSIESSSASNLRTTKSLHARKQIVSSGIRGSKLVRRQLSATSATSVPSEESATSATSVP
eukprot:CAMPEP_0171335902 /NCGR_PEP_ID=MMETSP0878-20121228/5648_1 /TAXON_ID=67004 /ORGANISM="Thalassiosira weissflogii, Strain CCMP1336" /LENGTH=73 /DNA_ID=CAMNT_0011837241 /DNA_START=7 /DNA_END=224 /DNA_ORIENTATION=+